MMTEWHGLARQQTFALLYAFHLAGSVCAGGPSFRVLTPEPNDECFTPELTVKVQINSRLTVSQVEATVDGRACPTVRSTVAAAPRSRDTIHTLVLDVADVPRGSHKLAVDVRCKEHGRLRVTIALRFTERKMSIESPSAEAKLTGRDLFRVTTEPGVEADRAEVAVDGRPRGTLPFVDGTAEGTLDLGDLSLRVHRVRVAILSNDEELQAQTLECVRVLPPEAYVSAELLKGLDLQEGDSLKRVGKVRKPVLAAAKCVSYQRTEVRVPPGSPIDIGVVDRKGEDLREYVFTARVALTHRCAAPIKRLAFVAFRDGQQTPCAAGWISNLDSQEGYTFAFEVTSRANDPTLRALGVPQGVIATTPPTIARVYVLFQEWDRIVAELVLSNVTRVNNPKVRHAPLPPRRPGGP